MITVWIKYVSHLKLQTVLCGKELCDFIIINANLFPPSCVLFQYPLCAANCQMGVRYNQRPERKISGSYYMLPVIKLV